MNNIHTKGKRVALFARRKERAYPLVCNGPRPNQNLHTIDTPSPCRERIFIEYTCQEVVHLHKK